MPQLETPTLSVAYLTGGPPEGAPVLVLHGWPDDATTFDRVVPALHDAGFRTYAPWLRGFGATRFRAAEMMRSGQVAALTRDALDLADALGLDRFAVVGHDWGARIAYTLASVFPQRITRCAALSNGWTPGPLATPALPQVKEYWYQWFMATERGAETVRRHGRAFARFQWEQWSPPGWFDEAEFEATAASFDNPDWPAITLHSYRVRWGEAEPDPQYAELERLQYAARTISVPTLMLQGEEDRVTLPDSTADAARWFSGPYERVVIDGAGHFLPREAPARVAELLIAFLSTPGAARG